jgi:hypothetical protein
MAVPVFDPEETHLIFFFTPSIIAMMTWEFLFRIVAVPIPQYRYRYEPVANSKRIFLGMFR